MNIETANIYKRVETRSPGAFVGPGSVYLFRFEKLCFSLPSLPFFIILFILHLHPSSHTIPKPMLSKWSYWKKYLGPFRDQPHDCDLGRVTKMSMVKLGSKKYLGKFQTLPKPYFNTLFFIFTMIVFTTNNEFRQLLWMQFKNVIYCINDIDVLLSCFCHFNIDFVHNFTTPPTVTL